MTWSSRANKVSRDQRNERLADAERAVSAMCVYTFLLAGVLLLCVGAVINQAEMLASLKQAADEQDQRTSILESTWLLSREEQTQLLGAQKERLTALERVNQEFLFGDFSDGEQESQNMRLANLERKIARDSRRFVREDSLATQHLQLPKNDLWPRTREAPPPARETEDQGQWKSTTRVPDDETGREQMDMAGAVLLDSSFFRQQTPDEQAQILETALQQFTEP
jgi:hypothetical protein